MKVFTTLLTALSLPSPNARYVPGSVHTLCLSACFIVSIPSLPAHSDSERRTSDAQTAGFCQQDVERAPSSDWLCYISSAMKSSALWGKKRAKRSLSLEMKSVFLVEILEAVTSWGHLGGPSSHAWLCHGSAREAGSGFLFCTSISTLVEWASMASGIR